MADTADTRGRIVATAVRLFCHRGFAAVGTADLCAAAGVNKGTLYHFFPDKLEVALTALRAYGDEVRAEYQQIATGRQPARRRVAALFALARDAAERSRAGYGVVVGCLHGVLAQELAAADERARVVLAEVADGWAEALAPLAADLMGVPRDSRRAVEAARVLMAYLNGAELAAKVANDPAVITRLGRRAAGLLTDSGSGAARQR